MTIRLCFTCQLDRLDVLPVDFGGVKFPTTLHIQRGDPRLAVAHNSMEITLSNVLCLANIAAAGWANTLGRTITVPDGYQACLSTDPQIT
jgi:hypothetical protein